MLNLIRLRPDLSEASWQPDYGPASMMRGFIVAPSNPSLRCFLAQGGAAMAI
jgi:hypothetical protein